LLRNKRDEKKNKKLKVQHRREMKSYTKFGLKTVFEGGGF